MTPHAKRQAGLPSRFAREVLDTPLDDAELRALNDLRGGFGAHIGLVTTACAASGCTGYVEVGPQLLQVTGVVNGGVYASIGETLGSIAAIAAAGRPAVGMSNYTDLLGSVSEGRIEAEAVPVHTGKRTHLWRVEQRADGRLVAVTNLKLMLLDAT